MSVTHRETVRAGVFLIAIGCVLVVGLAFAGTGAAQDADGFTASGQNGSIVLDGDEDDPITLPTCDEDEPRSQDAPEGVEWEEGCIQIDAEVHDTGTWSADPDAVTFPLITDTDPASLASEASVQFSAPDGLEGTINQSTGTLTIEGPLDVDASIEAPLGLGDDCHTSTTLNATTGESGDLTGQPLEGMTATVVDTTLAVPAFAEDSRACSGATDEYGLPSDSGESAFELTLWVDLE